MHKHPVQTAVIEPALSGPGAKAGYGMILRDM